MAYLLKFKNNRGREVLRVVRTRAELEKVLAKNWRIRASALIYTVNQKPGKARALALPGLWRVEGEA